MPSCSAVSRNEIFWRLKPLKPLHKGEVANRYLNGNQEIGFIESISKPFCGDCNRARLSADGSLYTCLFASKGHDLKAMLRMGAEQKDIRNAVISIWEHRDDAYSELRNEIDIHKVEMSFIGG